MVGAIKINTLRYITRIALLSTLFLNGCSAVHLHVEGWQNIDPTVVRVRDNEVFQLCKNMWWTLPLACTQVSWADKTCYVFVAASSPQWVLDHELEHCKGMYHPGDNWQELFDGWKAQQRIK